MRIADNQTERCLSYDEKPLLLFQKLKEGKKNPMFTLKHIRDIRSPIAQAQLKHAARQAASVESSSTNGKLSAGSGSGSGRSISRRPRLELNDASQTTTTGTAQQPGWLEVLSPTMEQKEQDLGSAGRVSTSRMNGSNENGGGSGDSGDDNVTPAIRETPMPLTELTYAVAIYPYMAEQDDELDVVV
jgi:bZIP factor